MDGRFVLDAGGAGTAWLTGTEGFDGRATDVIARIVADPDRDEEELAELRRRLRPKLAGLDVLGVEPVIRAGPPGGAKGVLGGPRVTGGSSGRRVAADGSARGCRAAGTASPTAR